MKAYVWEYVSQVSDSWHCGGGLLVIADGDEQARALIQAERDVQVDADEWDEATIYDLAMDYDSKVVTFPDAGCC